MKRSSDYEMGKAVLMGWTLDFRSASGGLKSISILKAGLLIRGYLSISEWAM